MMKNNLIIILLLVSSIMFGQVKDTLVYSSRRAITLQGASNFRDLGGYPTKDGHHVKWGHIYRSADISKLTDADLEILSARNFGVICDLRGFDEIKKSPDRIPPGTGLWINLPAGSENVGKDVKKMQDANNNPAKRDSTLVGFYSRTEHLKAKYKPMFDQLLALDNNKALLFHCAAGKDRTGVGAALILAALGVDKKYIVADYQATNEYWIVAQDIKKGMIAQGMSESIVNSMLAAKPEYIEAMFSAIQTKYGSMDSFLKTEMELDNSKINTLKKMYTN